MAAVLAAALGVVLGEWQRGRAVEKEAISERRTQRQNLPPLNLRSAEGVRADEFRRVRAEGEFVTQWTVFLENRPRQGQSGFYVLTPLQPSAGGEWLMVLRGWAPRDPTDRSKLPKVSTPVGRVVVEGEIRKDAGRVMQLGQPGEIVPGAILQNFDPSAFSAASKHAVAPFIITQLDGAQDGLIRDWPAPSAGSDKHRGYAFQWYGLALAALLFFIVTGFRRETNDAG